MGDGVDRDDVVACRRKLRGNTSASVSERVMPCWKITVGQPADVAFGTNLWLWDKSDGQ